MTRSTAYDTPAVPKGTAFTCPELEAFEAVSIPARLLVLKLKIMEWVDLDDDDSVASAIITLGEKPSAYHGEWRGLVHCVRVLRGGPSTR